MADFYQSDVGRDIAAGGGIGRITAYVDPESVTVTIDAQFPATVFAADTWAILGTPQATLTPSAAGPVGQTITLTLGAAGWRPEDNGKFVRINGGLVRITAITSATVASARVVIEMTSAVESQKFAWTLEGAVWGPPYGYPRCGALFEQRHWLAGSPGFPQQVWGSTIGEYTDFTLGTFDDDAVAYILASGELNPIMHLASSRGLVALTTGGEFSIRGGQDRAITPTNVKVTDQSNYGTAEVEPQRVGNEIFFTQRAGRKVRALSLNQYDGEQYVAPDMAVLAEHVTESGVRSMAYQPEPESLLWVVRNDGQMATLSADRDQEVFAWSRQLTQGGFEDVCVVPTVTGNRVFMVVARTIDGVTTRYIESFEPGLHTDSAVTGTSENGATVWSGLDHLEGLRVQVKGDGIVMAERVVTGGEITIERPAKRVEIGLGYITTVKTLTPEFMAEAGSSQGHQLSASEVKVRLLETIGCTINLQAQSFRRFGSDVLDAAPRPFSGMTNAGNLGWGDGVQQTLIQQTLPYDFHLLSVITTITANKG